MVGHFVYENSEILSLRCSTMRYVNVYVPNSYVLVHIHVWPVNGQIRLSIHTVLFMKFLS